MRPFFHLFCCGVVPAPIAVRRNALAPWPRLLFPPAAGWPCRPPAAVSPPRHSARPCGALPAVGTSVVATLLFFRLARRFASRACRGFPSSAARRGLPPAAPRRVPAVCTHFLSRAGREGGPLPCSGLRPCAPRGGRAARPPAPRGAPTRRAVFFIVFCYPRFRNFGALSALRRIKNHK